MSNRVAIVPYPRWVRGSTREAAMVIRQKTPSRPCIVHSRVRTMIRALPDAADWSKGYTSIFSLQQEERRKSAVIA